MKSVNQKFWEESFMKKTVSRILALAAILSVFFCVPFSASAAGELKIPTGFKYFNGHIYCVFETTNMTWKSAKKACEKRGGHLATITSKKENDFVTSLISFKSDDDVYAIGLYNKNAEADTERGHVPWSKPAWVTGEKVKYTNYDACDDYDICTGVYDDHTLNFGSLKSNGGWDCKANEETYSYSYNWCGYVCEWEVGKVSDIKQLKATASSVTLTWKDNDFVKKYIVYYYNTATKKYEKYDTVTKTSITISGLKAATTYKMAIAPVITNNGKTQTLGKTACTVATLPGRVTGLRIEDEVSLTWKSVKGADGYTIYLYNETSEKWSVYKNVKKNSYSIGEKFGSKTQQFKVRAFKKSSDGKLFYGGFSGVVTR